MATKTFEELKQLAIQIRDEKTNKQNTATRIGTQMLEHLNKLEQDYYDKTATDEELKQRDEKLTELSSIFTKIGDSSSRIDKQINISKIVKKIGLYTSKKDIYIKNCYVTSDLKFCITISEFKNSETVIAGVLESNNVIIDKNSGEKKLNFTYTPSIKGYVIIDTDSIDDIQIGDIDFTSVNISYRKVIGGYIDFLEDSLANKDINGNVIHETYQTKKEQQSSAKFSESAKFYVSGKNVKESIERAIVDLNITLLDDVYLCLTEFRRTAATVNVIFAVCKNGEKVETITFTASVEQDVYIYDMKASYTPTYTEDEHIIVDFTRYDSSMNFISSNDSSSGTNYLENTQKLCYGLKSKKYDEYAKVRLFKNKSLSTERQKKAVVYIDSIVSGIKVNEYKEELYISDFNISEQDGKRYITAVLRDSSNRAVAGFLENDKKELKKGVFKYDFTYGKKGYIMLKVYYPEPTDSRIKSIASGLPKESRNVYYNMIFVNEVTEFDTVQEINTEGFVKVGNVTGKYDGTFTASSGIVASPLVTADVHKYKLQDGTKITFCSVKDGVWWFSDYVNNDTQFGGIYKASGYHLPKSEDIDTDGYVIAEKVFTEFSKLYDLTLENKKIKYVFPLDNGEIFVQTAEATWPTDHFVYVSHDGKLNKKFNSTYFSYTDNDSASTYRRIFDGYVRPGWGFDTWGSRILCAVYGTQGMFGRCWYSNDYGKTWYVIFNLYDIGHYRKANGSNSFGTLYDAMEGYTRPRCARWPQGWQTIPSDTTKSGIEVGERTDFDRLAQSLAPANWTWGNGHLHCVCYDPYWNRIWVVTGDSIDEQGSYSAIWYCEDFDTAETTKFNDEKTNEETILRKCTWKRVGINRADPNNVDNMSMQITGIKAFRDCLIALSDSNKNGIFRINRVDKDNIKIEFVYDVARTDLDIPTGVMQLVGSQISDKYSGISYIILNRHWSIEWYRKQWPECKIPSSKIIATSNGYDFTEVFDEEGNIPLMYGEEDTDVNKYKIMWNAMLYEDNNFLVLRYRYDNKAENEVQGEELNRRLDLSNYVHVFYKCKQI